MMDWQSIFSTAGIAQRDNLVSICAAAETCAIAMVNHTLLQVSGPDAQKFLQGQCTCDIDRLASGDVLLGAHCTHKGRMNSSFTAAMMDADTIGLQVHASIADHAFAGLKKYIVFSKAELRVAQNTGGVYLAGPDAREILQQAGLDTPAEGRFIRSGSATVLYRAPDQFEVWASGDMLVSLLQSALKSGATLAGENFLDLLSIRRGIGEVRAETIEQFIPQDLNFQLVDGISFGKGCYTGQEIVARMHYKGKLKKHMYRGVAETENLPAPGSPVVDDTGKSVGQMVFAALNEDHQVEFLALSGDEAAEGEAFISGVKISWLPLPYAIPNK